jgi:hypothetical protein
MEQTVFPGVLIMFLSKKYKKVVLLCLLRFFILTMVSKHSEDGAKRAAIDLNPDQGPLQSDYEAT